MKVELHENCVMLVAENDWETKALKQIHKNGIHKVRYADEWEQSGGLKLESRSEAEYWGHR